MEEWLYPQLYPQLLRYCGALTGSDPDAQDLAQETCLRALIHAADLENASAAQCRSWLCRTARNLWIDRLRKAGRETPAPDAQMALAAWQPDLTCVAVQQLLCRLPQPEQSLFRLRYFEGVSSRELGEWFDMPPGTVRSKLSDARRKLRNMLEET